MEYREHNGLRLSRIGVGSYSLSGVFGPKDMKEYGKMIKRAYELGVNFFDTADAYGEAEEVLGRLLQPFCREVILLTKVGVKHGPKANLSYDYIKTACESSLRNLRTEYIDINTVHFDDPATPVEETVRALEELVKAGKIRKYGLGHLPGARVKEYINKGNVYSVLMELSAVARKASREVLPFVKKNNLAGIAFSVTGRGLLTGKITKNSRFEAGDLRRQDPQFQKEKFTFSLEVQQKLAEIGKRKGMSSAQVAIAWVLAQDGIVTALTGPSTEEHLEENIGGGRESLSPAELAEINHFIEEKEEWLANAEKKTLQKILDGDLPADNDQAFVDLVYCLETILVNQYLEEAEIMPVFYRLFSLKAKPDHVKNGEIKEIQKTVGAMLQREKTER